MVKYHLKSVQFGIGSASNSAHSDHPFIYTIPRKLPNHAPPMSQQLPAHLLNPLVVGLKVRGLEFLAEGTEGVQC